MLKLEQQSIDELNEGLCDTCRMSMSNYLGGIGTGFSLCRDCNNIISEMSRRMREREASMATRH